MSYWTPYLVAPARVHTKAPQLTGLNPSAMGCTPVKLNKIYCNPMKWNEIYCTSIKYCRQLHHSKGNSYKHTPPCCYFSESPSISFGIEIDLRVNRRDFQWWNFHPSENWPSSLTGVHPSRFFVCLGATWWDFGLWAVQWGRMILGYKQGLE